MNEIFEVNWWAIVIATVVAFFVGYGWYDRKMGFGKKWVEGIGGQAVPNRPLGPLLVLQVVSTFIYGWTLALVAPTSLGTALLVILAVAIWVKTNGFFSGKTKYAVTVEAGYIVITGLIFLLALRIT